MFTFIFQLCPGLTITDVYTEAGNCTVKKKKILSVYAQSVLSFQGTSIHQGTGLEIQKENLPRSYQENLLYNSLKPYTTDAPLYITWILEIKHD